MKSFDRPLLEVTFNHVQRLNSLPCHL